MKRLLLALSGMLASVAVAQTELRMPNLPEWEKLWEGFWIVDELEIPHPLRETSNSGPRRVSTAEDATGDGARFLQDTVYMTAEGAEKAVRKIRAALQESNTLAPNRLKDQCARNVIPTDSLAAFAAYVKAEAQLSDARPAQLVQEFLAALSPADALAYRQWAVSGQDFDITRIESPKQELLPRLEAQQADPKQLAAEMCRDPAGKE